MGFKSLPSFYCAAPSHNLCNRNNLKIKFFYSIPLSTVRIYWENMSSSTTIGNLERFSAVSIMREVMSPTAALSIERFSYASCWSRRWGTVAQNYVFPVRKVPSDSEAMQNLVTYGERQCKDVLVPSASRAPPHFCLRHSQHSFQTSTPLDLGSSRITHGSSTWSHGRWSCFTEDSHKER